MCFKKAIYRIFYNQIVFIDIKQRLTEKKNLTHTISKYSFTFDIITVY